MATSETHKGGMGEDKDEAQRCMEDAWQQHTINSRPSRSQWRALVQAGRTEHSYLTYFLGRRTALMDNSSRTEEAQEIKLNGRHTGQGWQA